MAVTLAKTTDSYTPPQTRTVALTREVALSAAMVGSIVTYNAQQYRVHSVEGRDWYAFEEDGQIKIDLNLSGGWWYPNPVAMITPTNPLQGGGHTIPVPVNALTRGVCLAKW